VAYSVVWVAGTPLGPYIVTRAALRYNFRDAEELVAAGQELTDYTGEQRGISCFLRHDGDVYLTYSTYGRGLGLEARCRRTTCST
jgi:predicted dithiol-disulfide oxidoreductase (DUF899 family)